MVGARDWAASMLELESCLFVEAKPCLRLAPRDALSPNRQRDARPHCSVSADGGIRGSTRRATLPRRARAGRRPESSGPHINPATPTPKPDRHLVPILSNCRHVEA